MKPPTKPQANLLKKITALGYVAPATVEPRRNPYSGKVCQLQPLACQLYDFITTKHHACGRDYTRPEWDRARYWFAANWPDEYYDLID